MGIRKPALWTIPVVGIALVSTAFAAAPMRGDLDESQEDPPTGSPATGIGQCLIDTDTNTLFYHLSFTPRIQLALRLAEELGDRLHAMMDLSDGLGRDGARLARASGVGLALDGAALPRRADVDWRSAVGDGEDYELLFTATGEVPPLADGIAITKIGRVVTAGRTGRVMLDIEGQTHAIDEMGWQHQS